MTDHLHTLKSVLFGVAGTAGTAVAGAEVGIGEGTLATLAAAVGLVVGAVKFMDYSMDRRLKAHTDEDNLRHDLILKDNQKGRHEMRQEIRHLRDLLAMAGVIPDHTPEAVRLPDESGIIPGEDETKP